MYDRRHHVLFWTISATGVNIYISHFNQIRAIMRTIFHEMSLFLTIIAVTLLRPVSARWVYKRIFSMIRISALEEAIALLILLPDLFPRDEFLNCFPQLLNAGGMIALRVAIRGN